MNAPALIQTARLPQCVYMLTDGLRVKIGFTANLERRISALSGACGVKLEPLRVFHHAGPRTERWLHKRFAAHRQHGEWFSLCGEMLTVTPPEEITSIPVVHVRRDVRLTLKERLQACKANAEGLSLPAREMLLLMISTMDDPEADQVIDLIREFVDRRPSDAA